MQFNKMH